MHSYVSLFSLELFLYFGWDLPYCVILIHMPQQPNENNLFQLDYLFTYYIYAITSLLVLQDDCKFLHLVSMKTGIQPSVFFVFVFNYRGV